ncbi:3-dehydroquinate synthase [Alicyclobacillus contaminans]|uniref:3-dehydroquinate synthase n=1 Tax=Alicyclobacillus contaminans TaxID=392016 RepID=UPI000407B9A5|nr:3-dehydroquinate synthase [Alicyclobacillus contaminans]GMA48686.1 3-dehydroquinate synthase [Alicyclobacillus contaminans]
MTVRLSVHTTARTYPVLFEAGLRHRVGELLAELGVGPDRPLFLITDEHLQALAYPDEVAASCRRSGYAVAIGCIPPSDASKSLAMAERLYEQMVAAGLRRNGVVLALGGGVVGDLAGFVAATYYRGIPFIQMPTTLLAHDSSIGGKVGVNLASGKNLVGAFHHPLAVWFDVDLLASLPSREWAAGMAEVIKHGLIDDASLVQELLERPLTEFPGAERCISLLARACAVKVRIVERDEREHGDRMKLNLGHTVGHAVEQHSHYRLNHGEAVSIGIAVETEIARRRALVTEEEQRVIEAVLAAHRLPVRAPGVPLDEILPYLSNDKKHRGAAWTFSLPHGIGAVSVVRNVRPEELRTAWDTVHERG